MPWRHNGRFLTVGFARISRIISRAAFDERLGDNMLIDMPQETAEMNATNMILTDVLAIYGASLSTAIAVWNYRSTRPQVRVLLIHASETIQGEWHHGIGISIQNVSARTVHISNVSLLYPFARSTFRDKLKHLIRFRRIPRDEGWCHSNLSLHGVEDGCPTSIEPGKSHWIFIRQEVLDELLEGAQSPRVKAAAQDALWRNTYSKAFEYHMQQQKPAQSAPAL